MYCYNKFTSILHLCIGSQTFVISRYIHPLYCTSLRMVTRVAETCGRSTIFIIYDTFIHLCAFAGFVTISNCSVQGRGLFKICYRHIERYQYIYLHFQNCEDEGVRSDILRKVDRYSQLDMV